MRKLLVLLNILIFFLFSCVSFIKDDDIQTVNNFEKNVYIMKKDVFAGNRVLKKDQEVKIIIITDKEWIKVYGYKVDAGLLKGERVLILYLFEDDFSAEMFDMELFMKSLFSIIQQKEVPDDQNNKVKSK